MVMIKAPELVLPCYAMPLFMARIYCCFEEQNRLKSAYGQLEFAHMTEILERHFPKSPAKICDIGGAAGDYAIHFAV